MSDRPEYGTAMLFRANLSFDGYRVGEVVEGDPDRLGRYVALGWLTECDEAGERIHEVPGDEDMEPPFIIASYDERVERRSHPERGDAD